VSQTRRLLKDADRSAGWLAGLFLFAVGQTVCIAGQMVQLSRVVNGVFLQGWNLSDCLSHLAWLGGWIIARGLIAYAQSTLAQQGALRFKTGLRHRLMTHFVALGPARIHQERTGDIIATAINGPEKVEAFYARYIPRAIQTVVIPILLALFVLHLDLLSGFILLATAPLIPMFMVLIGGLAKQRTEKQWAALSRMSAHFLDVLQGITTLKLFGRSKDQETEIRRIAKRYRITTMGVLKVAFVSGLVLELAASLSTAIVAVQIGVRLVEGHMAFQPGLLILLLTPEFYLPFRHLGTEHHASMEGGEAAKRIYAWLDEPLPIPVHSTSPTTIPDAPCAIRLDDISFRYPGRDMDAVAHCSCVIEAGKINALVGPSGSGKSTLLQLICKHIEPASGSIWINDQRLANIEGEIWRQSIAWVGQHPTLFYGTILDNIKMARPNASKADVEEAVHHAEFEEVAQALPHGLNTSLGEQAWRLSGGERQRLALARAFLKNAPLLIMDEPTAHLDPDSEEKVALAFERLAKERTVIVVAHRLRSVYRADIIHVMQQGRIVASGSHDELTQSEGYYARWVHGGLS